MSGDTCSSIFFLGIVLEFSSTKKKMHPDLSLKLKGADGFLFCVAFVITALHSYLLLVALLKFYHFPWFQLFVISWQFNSIILRWFTATIPSSSLPHLFIIFKVHLIKMSIRKSHIDKLPTQLKDYGKLVLGGSVPKTKTATHPCVTARSQSSFYVNRRSPF